MERPVTRCALLRQSALLGAAAMFDPLPACASPALRTRGVVLVPDDLTLTDWPDRAHAAGLTTIALHHGLSVAAVTRFVRSDAGAAFLRRCRELHLQVEYELHAMSDLLPRDLFDKQPELFRMGDDGRRTADANLCVHSDDAVEIVERNALRIARDLPPTTNRYFLWGDDGKPWCRCPRCRELSDSEQALLLENRLVRALRREHRGAMVAHLAYATSIDPPRKVRPEPGVFLEYAPIYREYDRPYADQVGGKRDALEKLDANLEVFPAGTAQALEYWLDCSRFSGWKKPAVRVPWNAAVLSSDLDTYGRRGIRHVTTFAVYLDADYVRRYGDPPIAEYGRILREWRPQRP